MKRKYILLISLILLTSCKDNSNILSSKNIDSTTQVKEFDKHLVNNSLISDGYYHIKTGCYFLEGNLKDIKNTILELDIKAKIEIDEDNNCIVKYVNGTSCTPVSENHSYKSNTDFYTYNENTYIRIRSDSKVNNYCTYHSNKSRIFLNLPFSICSNLEHAINYYSYPVPTTYINDNQIYIQENYKININESNGYLYAKYSSSYKELIHLEMNTKYYKGLITQYAYLIKVTLDKIEPFINEEEPEQFDLYTISNKYDSDYQINIYKSIQY